MAMQMGRVDLLLLVSWDEDDANGGDKECDHNSSDYDDAESEGNDVDNYFEEKGDDKVCHSASNILIVMMRLTHKWWYQRH